MSSNHAVPKSELILDAALKVIAEYGFHGSRISLIAKEAGVADGTIYLYFKNKEDILVSLFQERLGNLVTRVENSIEPTDTAAEALSKVVHIHFYELENNINLAHVTQIELRQNSRALRSAIGIVIKPYIKLLERLIRKGMANGEFRTDLDVRITRLLIFGALDEVVTSWLISGRKYPLTTQAEKTIEFFLQGLQ
jgi:TetR/AcrR family fatty acid metabolism transcriptional regulator